MSDFSYQLENPTGGTNWQAGILTAETLMSQKAGDNYNKFVIILTDGNPTFRYSSDGSAVASNYADSTSAFPLAGPILQIIFVFFI